MTCKDVMTAEPACCLPTDTVAHAAELMRDENVGPAPVVNNRTEKRLLGIVTDRDIAIKVVAGGRDPRSTRVDEVMTRDLVACGVDDDYDEALSAMAWHQVRRIPIVNQDGSLAGIISQADVARRTSEVGEVVEEISEPAGLGHILGFFMPRSSQYRQQGTGFATRALLMGAACLSAGVGIMYLLDPARGRSRRVKARDKAASLYNDAGHYAEKVQRDLRNRAAGVVYNAKAKLRHEGEIAGQKLEGRVRAKLGRITSHPHAIRVRAENGRITLEGSVLARELSGLLSSIRSIPGVSEIDNRLHTHEQAGNVPELQGEKHVPRQRWEFMQANWSPAARLAAGTLGGGLAIYGLRARGPVAKATATTVGVGLLARGISNKEVRSWT